jgi:hypothetical protein
VPLELLLEERGSCCSVHVCQPGQFVVADRFLVETAAVGVLVMLRQGRNEL